MKAPAEIPSHYYRNWLRTIRDYISRERNNTHRGFDEILDDVEQKIDIALCNAPAEDGTAPVYAGRDKLAEQIISATVAITEVPDRVLRGPRRTKAVTHARHLAIYLVCKRTTLTYSEVGRVFGNRDHSSVIHAKAKIDNMRFNNLMGVRETLAAIEERLGVA